MKQVTVINFTGRKGAGAVIAYEVTKSLIEKGMLIIAIISSDINNYEQWKKLRLEKLIVIKTYNSNIDFVFSTIQLLTTKLSLIKKQLSGYEIKLVYSPMVQPWTYYINKYLFSDTVKIVAVHDPTPHRGDGNFLIHKLHRNAYLHANKLVVLSETFREYCCKNFHKEPKDVIHIQHGDFSYYKDIMNENTNRYNYPLNKTNFLFFGRLSKYKGLEILDAAYKKLRERREDISLTVAGSGDYEPLNSLFKNVDDVTIINKWFEDSEIGNLFIGDNLILVLPYTDATQSGVIPIAIEYGVPVICSNTGGLVEQVKDNVTGILFETGDPNDLAKKMELLLTDPDLRNIITTNAKKENIKNSWTKLADKFVNNFVNKN